MWLTTGVNLFIMITLSIIIILLSFKIHELEHNVTYEGCLQQYNKDVNFFIKYQQKYKDEAIQSTDELFKKKLEACELIKSTQK